MSTITIRHDIPGRLRLTCPSAAVARSGSEACAALPGVVNVRVNPACAALVIRYDPARTCPTALLAAVKKANPAVPVKDRSAWCASCAKRAEPGKTGLARDLTTFLALSLAAGVIFIRQTLVKAVVLQTPFSPVGLIALAAALPLLRQSIRDLRDKRLSMEGFLAAGTTLAVLAGQALTALEILWIHAGAETLKSWAAERSRKSIAAILDLTSKNTFILAGEVEVEVPVSAVKPRDIVVLHTGEKVCVDGVIHSGEALLDESPLSGRPDAIHKIKGDSVLAGTYVTQGVIRVRAQCVGDATYLSRIMRLVEDSLDNKAPIESVGDSLAKRLVNIGFWATGLTLLFTGSLWRAFTVLLVMACPCATTLSASTAVSAALLAAARRGILVKGGRYLEEVGKADVVCFDKTGTLTTTEPRLEVIKNFSDMTEDELLLWAYSAEMHNHHPLARAIAKEAKARGIDPISHAVCEFTLGKGVRAEVGGQVFRLGNKAFMTESGIKTTQSARAVRGLENRGLTVIYLAQDKAVLAALAFANELRPDAAATVAALFASGVTKVALVTGDAEHAARDLCDRLGLCECRHSILPEEKAGVVRELRQNGSRVIMVGDGINDALALAEADIGVAMGATGSDVAIESADIALVHDDLADLLCVRQLGRETLAVARQNFLLATTTNIGGALAGALGLLSPVAAGLLHVVHTMGVLANSSRLLRLAPPARPALPAAPPVLPSDLDTALVETA